MTHVDLRKIKQLRKRYKLSQSEMAKIIGFNTLWPYQRRETGEQPFSADELYKIARYFKKPTEYFFATDIAKNANKKPRNAS